MKRIKRITILLLLLAAASQILFAQKKLPSFDSVSYFPREAFKSFNKIDSIKFIRFSRLLSDFGELKVFNEQDSLNIYRFTWTRSFQPAMVISLLIINNEGLMVVKTEKRKEVEQGRKKKQKEVSPFVTKIEYNSYSLPVSTEALTYFNSLIEKANFWEMNNTRISGAYHDGAGWLLEGKKGRNYNMVYRNSPSKDTDLDFRTACLFLIRLTKDSDNLEIY